MANGASSDTVELLRECCAGIRMAVSSIGEVLPEVDSRELGRILTQGKEEHEALGREVSDMLRLLGGEEKGPNAMAKGMSWMKTNLKMAAEHRDGTVADLITDGCNMGIKSLRRYVNEYESASEEAKGIAQKLMTAEERLAGDIGRFL